MTKILLVLPPFTQLNTPYPSICYLKGFLKNMKISSFQMDLGIETVLVLFNKETIAKMMQIAEDLKMHYSDNVKNILLQKEDYIHTINDVVKFLQGKNPSLAHRISTENFLPKASRLLNDIDLEWFFGTMGVSEKAKHIATLYLEDLSDFIVECIDSNFGFTRYAEKLGRCAHDFDLLEQQLIERITLIDELYLNLLSKKIQELNPEFIGFSVPFPGNLLSTLRCGQMIKQKFPHIKVIMGGGFPNTELRSLTDSRIFKYLDFITLDKGELPLKQILNGCAIQDYKRTYFKNNKDVVYSDSTDLIDFNFAELPTPSYEDLKLNQYLSVIEVINPMHSLWTNGRWNKLTMAHGCYWAKCTFCDVSLDYICDYKPLKASDIVDRVEELIKQTGETGFHFVDEAAPPKLMKAFAEELLKRKLNITWWTNVRFEKSFSPELCELLALSGCIAVSGGLEVASDRLLKLINKGVTVEQVSKVASNFTNVGILVHAYLMYGFPTQDELEIVNSLDMVRQMFELGIIHSGFWHRFALTVHSPVFHNYKKYNIEPLIQKHSFASNDVDYKNKSKINYEKYQVGLNKALYNFLHHNGFDFELQEWFDFEIPKATVSKHLIGDYIQA